MINTLLSKQLDILLPNTNKALSEALKSASPKELEAVSSFKDLKSMMSSILKQSTSPDSSNKVLLELVKNNPTLKNLGSVSGTIKELINSLKSDKNPLPIEKTLQNILTDIKDLKGSQLKQKLVNPEVSLKENIKDEKILKSLLVDIKDLKDIKGLKGSELKQKIISSLSLLEENPKNEKVIKNLILNVKDLQVSEKDVKGLEKIVKNLLTDTLSTKNLKTIVKESQPFETTIKNFLTDIKDLKGSELKEKLNNLKTLLETNFKAPNNSSNISSNNTSNILKDIVSNDLKSLLFRVNEKESLPIEKTLKNFLIDIKDLKGDELKNKFVNSGIFLESNIKNAKESPSILKDIVSNDLKSILHKAKEEITQSSYQNQNEVLKHIDKLSLQIDHYQLLSYLSNGTSLYLPFSWDQLEEGNIELKKVKDDKFFCDIDLKLKDFGEVNLKLVLYEENQINIHVYSKSDEFKSLVKDNIADLRSRLIGINITPREIRVFDFKENQKIKTSPYATIDDNLKMGFEIKV